MIDTRARFEFGRTTSTAKPSLGVFFRFGRWEVSARVLGGFVVGVGFHNRGSWTARGIPSGVVVQVGLGPLCLMLLRECTLRTEPIEGYEGEADDDDPGSDDGEDDGSDGRP